MPRRSPLHSSQLFAVSDAFSPGPLTAPLNLRVSDIESNQVTVHWDPVSHDSIMGELKEYKVCMIIYRRSDPEQKPVGMLRFGRVFSFQRRQHLYL